MDGCTESKCDNTLISLLPLLRLQTTEQYLLQLLSKRENYLTLQEMLQQNSDITSLNDVR